MSENKKYISISYSRQDEEWKDRILKYLKILNLDTLCVISTHSPHIKDIESIIKEINLLNNADIVILLLTFDYLSSDDIRKSVIPNLLKRQKSEGFTLIPILVKPIPLEKIDWLSSVQFFPEDRNPLSQRNENEIDSILFYLASYIQDIILKPEVIEPTLTTESAPPKKKAPQTRKRKKQSETEPLLEMEMTIPEPPNIHDMDHEPVIGAKELAEELADLLDKQKSDKATMIGIFGQWGRGKTFLMDLIWKHLEKKGKDNTFERVDFHAWKYQDTPASWAYLYEAFAKKYFEMPQRKSNVIFYFFKYLLAWAKNLIKRIKVNINDYGWFPLIAFFIINLGAIVWSILSLKEKIGFIYYLSRTLLFSVPVLFYIVSKIFFIYRKNAIKLFKKYTRKRSYNKLLGIQKEIQDDLSILLKAWLPDKKLIQNKKILLFVDDLDRCSEERLIQVIDSLRVMLEDKIICRRVIALVSVDERILTRAIAFKYQKTIKEVDETDYADDLNILKLTQEYLDKLFLIGVKLNPLSKSEKKDILYSITKDKLAPIRKDKKLPQSVLDKLKDSEDTIFDSNSFNKILSSQTIPKDNVELIKKYSEFQPELTVDEYERFNELLPFMENSTPRNIRILYYQYILAKRLLKKDTQLYGSISQNGSGIPETNTLLDLLFLVYRYRKPAEKKKLNGYFSKLDFDELEKTTKEKPLGEDNVITVIQRIKKIDSNNLTKLKSIIDTVVPY